MPAFIVTLTTMMFFSGAAIWFVSAYTTSGSSIGNLPRELVFLGQGRLFGLPVSILVAGAVAVVGQVVLQHTLYGRWLFAIGLNPRAAAVSGVPVRKVVFWAYVISGAVRRPRLGPLHRPARDRLARAWASASCSTWWVRR